MVVWWSDTPECLDIMYYSLSTSSFWPCCGAIAYPHLQATPARILSASYKRRNSEIWFFGLDRRPSHGSLRYFNPLHPNIKTSSRPSIYIPDGPDLIDVGDDIRQIMEKGSIGSGWISIISSNSRSCDRFTKLMDRAQMTAAGNQNLGYCVG